jgi:dihydrolipoamide dehydrogenase
MNKSKLLLVILIVGLISCFFYFDLGSYLSLDYLKESKDELLTYYQQNKGLSIAAYFVVYVLATALSLPGATILTLAGGAIFGLGLGLLIVSFASSIGASLAFLVSRYLLKDSLEKKYSKQFKKINEGIEKEGAFYLFSLRLIPIFPFFLINLLMGLTKMNTLKFYIVSQVGMLAGTAVYVNAGSQLADINSISEIAKPEIIGTFVLLGLFPLIAKKLIDFLKAKKVYKGYQKPKNFDYNLVAIGAGAGGLVTTYIGAAVKAKVALIEKNKMGGDCLNTGCVPSKALIKTAKLAHQQKNPSKYGIDKIQMEISFEKVMQRVHQVIKKIEPHDSVERYEGLGVECFQGEAKIISPWEVEVNGKKLRTKNIVIATGGSPLLPAFEGLEQVKDDILVSENLWDIKELPKKLVVLGAGPIGCEMAQSFSRLGSEVSLVDMATRPLPREDEDASNVVQDNFKQEGIHQYYKHKILSFRKQGEQNILVVENEEGEKIDISFDKAICALGRKANTKGFGLEELGIELNKNGTIATNEKLQTNFPNIYAVGDVAGPYQFTHTAAHMAWYASVNSLFFNRFKVDYRVIPWATFTDPEVARVGISETEAKEQNIEYDLYKYELDDLDRAIADSTDQGFVKVLCKKGSDQILGVCIVGASASDIIAEFVLAMKHGLGLNKILGTIHLYPSMAEANKYVAGVWKNATKPEKLLSYLQKFHAMRR